MNAWSDPWADLTHRVVAGSPVWTQEQPWEHVAKDRLMPFSHNMVLHWLELPIMPSLAHVTRFIDKREKLVVLNSSFKDKSHCLNPGSEEEEETLHFKNSFLLKPVAWLFGRLTYNVQGPTFSSFTDEMPSWSYLPVKWQIRVVIFIFIFTAALLVPLIILI